MATRAHPAAVGRAALLHCLRLPGCAARRRRLGRAQQQGANRPALGDKAHTRRLKRCAQAFHGGMTTLDRLSAGIALRGLHALHGAVRNTGRIGKILL